MSFQNSLLSFFGLSVPLVVLSFGLARDSFSQQITPLKFAFSMLLIATVSGFSLNLAWLLLQQLGFVAMEHLFAPAALWLEVGLILGVYGLASNRNETLGTIMLLLLIAVGDDPVKVLVSAVGLDGKNLVDLGPAGLLANLFVLFGVWLARSEHRIASTAEAEVAKINDSRAMRSKWR